MNTCKLGQVQCSTVCIQLITKTCVRPFKQTPHVTRPFLGATGLVGKVPPRLEEFFNLPFLVLKARHPANPIYTTHLVYREHKSAAKIS